MIDREILKIAHDRIRIEISEHNKSLRIEIDRIKAEMAGRGVLCSGATIKLISDLCVDAVKTRAQLVWQTLFRFITTTGISYTEELSEELKGLVGQHLPEKLGDLRGYIKQAAEMAGSPKQKDRYGQELDIARKGALAKVGTEIDLFVHSLRKKINAEQDKKTSTVFNIYSPVGSIQTGDNAIANVTQKIDTEIKYKLEKVLEEIGIALNQSEVELACPKGELIEVVQESQVELKKDKPNITRLRSLLTTVGMSIQVVSSFKPAYETLKQALTFIGISLP